MKGCHEEGLTLFYCCTIQLLVSYRGTRLSRCCTRRTRYAFIQLSLYDRLRLILRHVNARAVRFSVALSPVIRPYRVSPLLLVSRKARFEAPPTAGQPAAGSSEVRILKNLDQHSVLEDSFFKFCFSERHVRSLFSYERTCKNMVNEIVDDHELYAPMPIPVGVICDAVID